MSRGRSSGRRVHTIQYNRYDDGLVKFYIEIEPPASGEVISIDAVSDCVPAFDTFIRKISSDWKIVLDSECKVIGDRKTPWKNIIGKCSTTHLLYLPLTLLLIL